MSPVYCLAAKFIRGTALLYKSLHYRSQTCSLTDYMILLFMLIYPIKYLISLLCCVTIVAFCQHLINEYVISQLLILQCKKHEHTVLSFCCTNGNNKFFLMQQFFHRTLMSESRRKGAVSLSSGVS